MKLLQKTIRGYLLYSVIILLLASVAFYIVIQNVLRHEADEELLATKNILKPQLLKALNDGTLEKINFLDENITIALSSSLQQYDSLTTLEMYNSYAKEMIPYRILHSAFSLNGQGFLVHRKISLLENNDLVRSIVTVQVTFLVVLLAGLFLFNQNLSKKIWRPFYTTLKKLQHYNIEKDKALALGSSGIREFDDLNQSLEELTARVHRTFTSQKEFTENASHEMQTPLAIFQSKLELLMQTNPLSEEQAGLMDELADAGQRMQRLNKSLVLLTKIENNQFLDIEQISLNDIIQQYLKQFSPQIEDKELTVDYQEEDNIILNANRILIEIMVSNLMGNAIRHNCQQGSININICHGLCLINNTGKNIAVKKDNLFRRFQKDSTDTNSIGLGLEIAKKIADLYHYKITYQFNNHLHNFKLKF